MQLQLLWLARTLGRVTPPLLAAAPGLQERQKGYKKKNFIQVRLYLHAMSTCHA